MFFDLYGTLLILGDMKQAWADWMEVLYAALCPRELFVSREDFDNCCHQFFGKDEPKAEAGDGLTVFERRLLRLAAGLQSPMELPALKETAARAVNAWQMHVRLDPQAAEVLTALKNSKTLGLISNFDHPPHARRILSQSGLDDFFETIVVSGEVGIKKPDPAIFRIALEATGLRREEVIYVGDTQEDVNGAIAAGIRPILIARPADLNQPKLLDYNRKGEKISDHVAVNFSTDVTTIRSLPEIFEVLDNLDKTNVR